MLRLAAACLELVILFLGRRLAAELFAAFKAQYERLEHAALRVEVDEAYKRMTDASHLNQDDRDRHGDA